jgi:hypothetical protein
VHRSTTTGRPRTPTRSVCRCGVRHDGQAQTGNKDNRNSWIGLGVETRRPTRSSFT